MQSSSGIFFTYKKYFIKIFLILVACIFMPCMIYAQQNLRGRIIDTESQYPLEGVLVKVANLTDRLPVVTDAQGEFLMENIPTGRVELHCSYLGYENVTIPNILITAGKENFINITMHEKVNQLQEIVITVDKKEVINEMAAVSSRTFSVEDSKRFAGSINDVSRMAQNYAGVAAGNDSRNDIIIRGNTPTGLLWMLEGVSIFNPNHFSQAGGTGGPVSMLNNNNLSNSDFLTSAFPAEYGNAISGVFDLRLRSGNRHKREYMLQASFMGLEAGAEGYFSKKSPASYIANFRYSTLDIFHKLGINTGTGNAVPEYYDLTYKISLPTQRFGKFDFWGLGGKSHTDQKATQERDSTNLYAFSSDVRFGSQMFTSGLSHFINLDESMFLKSTLAYSSTATTIESFKVDFSTDTRSKNYGSHYDQRKIIFHTKLQKKLDAANTISLGFNAEKYASFYKDSILRSSDTAFLRLRDFDGSLGVLNAYFQYQLKINPKLTWNAGLHYINFMYNKSESMEPRTSLKYLLRSNMSISFGYGLHHQMNSLHYYFAQTRLPDGSYYASNKNLGLIASHHYVLAYDWNLNKDLRCKLEAYLQALDQVPVHGQFSVLNEGAEYRLPNIDSLKNLGKGQNKGIELTIEKFFSKQYYFLFTTSYFQSLYRDENKNWHSTTFDNRYIINALAGKEFQLNKKNTLILDIKSTYAGGRKYTPIDIAASKATSQQVLDTTQLWQSQYPDYFRIDAKISFRRNAKHTTHEIGFDLMNLTNHKNIFSREWDENSSSIKTIYQTGFLPIFLYRLTF